MENNKQEHIINKHFYELDWMEALAILLIILDHGTVYAYWFWEESKAIYYINYFFTTVISTSVCSFYFANGYLLFNKPFNLKKHMYKTLRIFIITVIWALIKVFVHMPLKGEYLAPMEIIGKIWNLEFGWTHTLWFMGSLICLYIFFPVLKAAYDYSHKILVYFTVIITAFVMGNTLINHGITLFTTWILHSPKVYQGTNFLHMFNPFVGIYWFSFVYFCLGGCVYNLREKIMEIDSKKRNIAAVIVLILSLSVLFLVGICYSRVTVSLWDVAWGGFDTIYTLIAMLCVYVLFLNVKKDNKLIGTIAKNTMGIYLIHEFFVYPTVEFVKSVPAFCNVPANIVYAALILVASMLVSMFIKKIPVVKKILF